VKDWCQAGLKGEPFPVGARGMWKFPKRLRPSLRSRFFYTAAPRERAFCSHMQNTCLRKETSTTACIYWIYVAVLNPLRLSNKTKESKIRGVA